MTVKLSTTSKLGTKSWSLQALETCPGSVGADGELVPACSGCYATAGTYHFKGTKAVRAFNKEDWQRDAWANDMVAALSKDSHFRWFDSGDVYALELAKKMLYIMENTPNTKHWLPTRMYKFDKFKSVLEKMQALPNVMVRYSSDNIDGTYTDGVHGSTILPEATMADANTHVCTAPSNDGKCGACRACYDKSVAVIGYIAHGVKMKKVIRIHKEAA